MALEDVEFITSAQNAQTALRASVAVRCNFCLHQTLGTVRVKADQVFHLTTLGEAVRCPGELSTE